ncbi:MAG: InlB B-repeat-containing protein [Clostridia bacterium]|nr:InlB B-repeat-containing protein [Clostridia bacterium]
MKKIGIITASIVMILCVVFGLAACSNKVPLPEGYYRITVQQTTGGSVNASKSSAQEGEEITLSYNTNNGYLFVKVTVKDSDNQEVPVNNGKFTMPASDVTVSATFERISDQKYFLEIEPGIYYNIELISPDEEQFERNQGKISAGTRVVLGCDIWDNGYELKSWNVVDSNGNRITVDSDNSFIMPNSNVIVSAIVGEKTYTVSVDPETARIFNVTIRNEDDNNSIVEDGGSVKFNDRVTLSYEFKVQGYTLNGWKNQNGERIYETGTLVQSNLVISAIFSANQYGLRIYDRWGEDGEYNSVGISSFYLTNKDGQRIDQLIDTNERNKARTDDEITIHCEPRNQNFAVDYYILRYYDDDGSHEDHITPDKFTMIPDSVTVSVKMKLVENTYNVNYVLDDGGRIAPYAPRTFKSTDNTLDIPNPTREGYKFDGWEEQDSMHVAYLDGAISLYPYEFIEDLTLTAKWIKTATITYDYSHYSPYDLDGFNGKYVNDNNPTTYVLGETLILQNPIYAYGNFEGWYTSPTFEEGSKITELYFEDENDLEDITLYAKMSLKSFHINFVKIGVSTEGTTKVLATSAYLDWFDLAEDPRDLTRDIYNDKTYTLGYTFAGFFVDADLTTPITEVSNELDHDITIYAKETLDTYTITYYERGEITGTRTYTIETESIGLLNGSNFDNAYGHWIFRGWRLNDQYTGEQFEFPTTIHPSADPEKFHGNLEFYAYYQEP